MGPLHSSQHMCSVSLSSLCLIPVPLPIHTGTFVSTVPSSPGRMQHSCCFSLSLWRRPHHLQSRESNVGSEKLQPPLLSSPPATEGQTGRKDLCCMRSLPLWLQSTSSTHPPWNLQILPLSIISLALPGMCLFQV